jgi:hypothetical protein
VLFRSIAALVIGNMVMRKSQPFMGTVTIGTRDKVYYSHGAAEESAIALGHALQATGFFNDRGTSVLLTGSKTGQVLSFVLNEGAWDNPNTVASFEEIARRVATSIGGFPVQVRLVDASWSVKKTVHVGKVIIGARDAIYYVGSAPESDATALGEALRSAGYLGDLGVTVLVSEGDGTAIGFVVGNGVWDRPDAIAGFTALARRVAPSVGGLPVRVRLLSAEMETKREMVVE